MFIHIVHHSLLDCRVKSFRNWLWNFFSQKNHCKIGKKMQFFLVLKVIIFLPPEHNAKNPTSLGAFFCETLFFEWPLLNSQSHAWYFRFYWASNPSIGWLVGLLNHLNINSYDLFVVVVLVLGASVKCLKSNLLILFSSRFKIIFL